MLTDRGLRAAVEMLAGRSPVPVEIAEVPEARLPEGVAAAACYLIAEALGGSLAISSPAGAGTTLRAEIPR